jgi:hypothetical protein
LMSSRLMLAVFESPVSCLSGVSRRSMAKAGRWPFELKMLGDARAILIVRQHQKVASYLTAS